MQIFLIFLQQEFLLAGKNLSRILQNFLFFFITLSIFLLISQNQQGRALEQHVINVILFCLIFNLIFSNSDFLAKDSQDGTLDQIIIFHPNLEVYIAAKMLGNWIIFSLPILLVTPLVGISLNLEKIATLHFFVLISLASLSMNFICAFCGSLSIAENKAPMISIIALPLIIPVLLIACGNLQNIEDQDLYLSAKFLLGICIFTAAFCILATTKIAKILSE